MNSEKVKEIKKALECMSGLCKDSLTDTCFNCEVCKNYNEESACKEALTLINELESENDTLHTNLCEWRKENQQLKDRIAELESKNETLRNAKVVYENVDYCYEDLKKAENRIAELEKEKTEQLKQFAESICRELWDVRVDSNGEQFKCGDLTSKDVWRIAKQFDVEIKEYKNV